MRIIKIWNTLVSKSCSMLKTFIKAFAPPIPVEKFNVLLSDPETPVTPYEFWLEHKPDLLFEKPLIFLIFVVYRPHSSFQDIIYFQAKINKQKYSFQKVNIELFSTFEYIQTCSLHSKKVALRIIQIFNYLLIQCSWIYSKLYTLFKKSSLKL